MSAEILRQAAALMRERAEAATDTPWVVKRAHPDMPAYVAHEGWWVIASRTEQWDAEHIASWHPAMALEIAAFLDFAATYGDQPEPQSPTVQFAASIARAYIGDPS